MILRIRKQEGMVLVTVAMIVMVMSLLLTAIISQNLSQVSSVQAQIDKIKAQELAIGAFWKAQADLTNTSAATVSVPTENLNGKNFTITADARPATSTVPATYQVSVSYPN